MHVVRQASEFAALKHTMLRRALIAWSQLPVGKVRMQVHFAWHARDFVVLNQKLLSTHKRNLLCDSLLVSSPLSIGKVRKGDAL